MGQFHASWSFGVLGSMLESIAIQNFAYERTMESRSQGSQDWNSPVTGKVKRCWEVERLNLHYLDPFLSIVDLSRFRALDFGDSRPRVLHRRHGNSWPRESRILVPPIHWWKLIEVRSGVSSVKILSLVLRQAGCQLSKNQVRNKVRFERQRWELLC